MAHPARQPIREPIIPKNINSASVTSILARETPGFTSPNAVLETIKRVAAIEAGSCEVNSDATKKVVPTVAASNNATSPSTIELLVPGLINSNE